MMEPWHPVSEPWPDYTLCWAWDPEYDRACLAKCDDRIHWYGPPSNPREIHPTHWKHLDVPGRPL